MNYIIVLALRLAELNNFHQLQVLKRDINSSQTHTGDCYRNASFNGASLLLDSDWFTEMPEVGKLRFDYVSPVRVPEGMVASEGTWGCAIEEYGVRDMGNEDSSLEGDDDEDDEGGESDKVYTTNPHTQQQHQYSGNTSTTHSKEQFVYELIENLFSKRFEPRSRAKRKESRSNPKNITPNHKRGGPKDSGLFLSGVKVFANAMGVVNKSIKAQRQVGYVEKFKQKTLNVPIVREIDANPIEYNSSSDDSSGDDFGLDEEDESSPDRSPGHSPTTGAAWNPRSKFFNRNTTTANTITPSTTAFSKVTQEFNQTSPKKKKTTPSTALSKFKEQHLAEAADYWRDTADTCWVRCKSIYLDLLKKKVSEIVQLRERDRDIK